MFNRHFIRKVISRFRGKSNIPSRVIGRNIVECVINTFFSIDTVGIFVSNYDRCLKSKDVDSEIISMSMVRARSSSELVISFKSNIFDILISIYVDKDGYALSANINMNICGITHNETNFISDFIKYEQLTCNMF